jgi:sulfopyruvate decarboxylase subunit beta
MQTPELRLIHILKDCGIDRIATLPCDRIKNLLPLIPEHFRELRLTREENGVGICAGAWLAGARPAMLIQSTGLGNMLTALESLNVACRIPLPVLASWRGVYKEGIEAQKPLGLCLPAILEAAGIDCVRVDDREELDLIPGAVQRAFDQCRPGVVLISPRVWEGSPCPEWKPAHPGPSPCTPRPAQIQPWTGKPVMTRLDAIRTVAPLLDRDIALCNLGIPSKELFASADRPLNYYMTGSMGLATAMGLGLALASDRTVVVFDGDGSLLMNPNALVEAGLHRPPNLIVLALDNGSYGSTGSQETWTGSGFDLQELARACGIPWTARASTPEDLEQAFLEARRQGVFALIHVVLKPGNAKVGNIPLGPEEITERFRTALAPG